MNRLLAFVLLIAAPVQAQGAAAPVDQIIIEKARRTLTLMAQGKPIRRYTQIRLGDAPLGHKQFEGDEKTPEGEYRISGRNPGSSYYRSLRISYPNARDRAYAARFKRAPGGDIFIHGQPNGAVANRISSDWTDGCIALSNAEMAEVWQLVPNGARVTIRP